MSQDSSIEKTHLGRHLSDKPISSSDLNPQKAILMKKYGNVPLSKSNHALKHSGRSPESKQDSSSTSTASVESSPSKSKNHVLLVEDVRVSQRVARVSLMKGRFKVDVAWDGVNAVEKYAKTNYDIVLMDIQLPKMDGVEATKKIREIEASENRPSLIVFGLTGNVEDDDLEKYKAAGMNGCIAKGNILLTALQEALVEHEKDPESFVISKLGK